MDSESIILPLDDPAKAIKFCQNFRKLARKLSDEQGPKKAIMAIMETKWHLRARAVIYENGKCLVVRTKNGSHSFLAGGHVESGESVPAALEREMLEETGRKCEIKEYLGAIENAWIKDGGREWEITHFFHVVIPDLEADSHILPAEEGFDFLWINSDEFEKLNLLPVPLRNLMKNWAGGDTTIWWASTMIT